jgi:predicted ABC-type ATPase
MPQLSNRSETPRIRMVAGPNGSGKTTLVDHLQNKLLLPLGRYLNPDDVDLELAKSGRVDLGRWESRIDPTGLLEFIKVHPLSSRLGTQAFTVQGTTLIPTTVSSVGYLASILSDYLRRGWLLARASFTFETVMSSRDKVELVAEARTIGYRTYLYYICTDAPLINERRVASRVADGGHSVSADKIYSRYERSLALLPEAIRLSDRAFMFDNSGLSHRLVAEYESGRSVSVVADPPEWLRALNA